MNKNLIILLFVLLFSCTSKKGTEEGRLKYGEDIWAKTLQMWIRVYKDRGLERVIVTDLRFPNEVKWLKQQGGYTFQ